MKPGRALGKGLASLIPITSSETESHTEQSSKHGYFECELSQIVPAKNQPRKLFAQKGLAELAASIQEQGIIQPLIVRPVADEKYELIAGERRYRAAKLIGLHKVPVVLTEVANEKVFELALIENIQRQDLNPIEEALAYRELQEKYGHTQEEIARRVGKERSSVANSLRLLGLPEEIRGDLIEGKISMGHARALLSLDNLETMLKLKRKIILNQLSVRETEELIRAAKTNSPKAFVPKRSMVPESFRFLEEKLCKTLGTKVRMMGNSHKGKIVIEYFTPDELDRLFQHLKHGPEFNKEA